MIIETSSLQVRLYYDKGLPNMVTYTEAYGRPYPMLGNTAARAYSEFPIYIYGVSALFSREPFIPETKLNMMIVEIAPGFY